MNKSLFRSHYAWAAILALVVWVGLFAAGLGRFGIVGSTGRGARLVSGALALFCMLLAIGYVLRKYMHKYGYSPEFKLKVPIAQLERAETRLAEVRREILKGQHTTQRGIEALVARVLREEGVQRVLRVEVSEGPAAGPKFELRASKAFPLGKAAAWLHLHLYISIAMAIAVFVHGGDGFDSGMGATLLGVSVLVIVSGVVGIFLWAFGPAWLTRRERDLSIEESFVMREGFSRKLKELLEKMDADLRAVLEDASAKGAAGSGGENAVRVLLKALPAGDAARRVQLQDALVLRGQLQRVDAEFRALWRIRLGFMAWRAVHLPAALFLCVAVAAHVLSIALY